MALTEGLATYIAFWLAVVGFPGALWATVLICLALGNFLKRRKGEDTETAKGPTEEQKALAEMTAKYEEAHQAAAKSAADIVALDAQIAYGVHDAVEFTRRIRDLEQQLEASNEKLYNVQIKSNSAITTSLLSSQRVQDLEQQLEASNEKLHDVQIKSNLAITSLQLSSQRVRDLEQQLEASNEKLYDVQIKLNSAITSLQLSSQRVRDLEQQLEAANEKEIGARIQLEIKIATSELQIKHIQEISSIKIETILATAAAAAARQDKEVEKATSRWVPAPFRPQRRVGAHSKSSDY